MPLIGFFALWTPLNIFTNVSQRSFFPGQSFFFWLLIAMAFYIFYLYSKSKNKKDFLKSQYNQSVSLLVLTLFISFISMNILLSDPPRASKKKALAGKTVDELVKEDQALFQEIEINFTKSSIHLEYLNLHFSIPAEWTVKYDKYLRDDLTIANIYYDHLESEDTDYSDNANLGLGIIYYKKDSLKRSLAHFKAISQKNFPYANYYQGKIYVKLKDTPNAIAHFNAASQVKDVFQDKAIHELIYLMNASGKHKELYALLNTRLDKKHFSPFLLSRLYFLNNDVYQYFSTAVSRAFGGFKWTGFIAASLILLIWGFYMVRLDIFEKESNVILFLVLITGMALTPTCFYLYDFLELKLGFSEKESNLLLYCIFGIGVVEEFVKIVPLLILLTFGNKIINEPYDYILYAAVSALGFSFMENLIYFDGHLDGVIHGRALTSVPGHIIDSSIVAYGLVLAKYRYRSLNSIAGFLIFFLFGAINHGLYDYWLFADMHIFFLLGFIISISVWIIILNNCLNNSPSFNHLADLNSGKTQIILSLSMISILIFEYVLVAIENGPTYANDSVNKNLVVGGIMITYFSSRLTNMDLIRGYWATIPLRSVGEKKSGTQFIIKNFLLRLLSGDTFIHSFVHTSITLEAHPENNQLINYFNNSAKGMISDRLVVTCTSPNGKDTFEDPYWFRIDTSTEVNTGGSSERIFLFRFEKNRPSFENESSLVIFLFSLKDINDLEHKLNRENLRSLGKAVIKKV